MSVSLNGNTANYLTIVSDLGISGLTAAHTWCGWFKPANANAYKMAFMAGPGTNSTHVGLRLTNTGTIDFYRANAVGSNFGTYAADTWYFLFWKRGTVSTSLVGGMAPSGCGFDADGDFTTTTGSSSTTGTFVRLEIGRKNTDGYPWNGEIACFRVWDADLTLAELRAEAISATPVKSANLRANWRLASNTDLTSTVNGYVLTANGTVSTGSTEPADIGSDPQILLPSADITTTGWTSSAGGALYAAIDESVASDSDYIYTGTLDAECEIQLQSGSTPGSGSKNLSVRCPAGFTPVGGWQVSLYQGASLVQSFTSPAPAANTTATFSVTNAITDYSDLRVRIKSTA